jgi:hypothetical protein
MIPSYTPAVVDFKPMSNFQQWLTQLQRQLPRYLDNLRTYLNVSLLPSLNDNLYGLGQNIASGTIISPVNYVTLITGSAPVQTINAPMGFAGTIVLIARDGFTTVATGNILLAVSIGVNHAGMFTWHGALQKWAVVTS